MEGLPQWALLVTLDLLKGWPVVRVSLHHRRMHPEAYHKDHVPEQRRKVLWDYEEKVLLARGEITMLEEGTAVNSKTLAEQFPGRSSEAIKKMLQSERYKRILESLTSVHGTHDGPAGGEFFLFSLCHWNA